MTWGELFNHLVEKHGLAVRPSQGLHREIILPKDVDASDVFADFAREAFRVRPRRSYSTVYDVWEVFPGGYRGGHGDWDKEIN